MKTDYSKPFVPDLFRVFLSLVMLSTLWNVVPAPPARAGIFMPSPGAGKGDLFQRDILDHAGPDPTLAARSIYTTTESYADDFDLSPTTSTYYTGSDGTLDWSSDWIEVNDDGDPDTGDTQVRMDGNARSGPAYLWLQWSGGDGDVVTNTAFYDSDISGGTAEAVFAVNGPPAFALDNAASPGEDVGYHSLVTYTITMSNTGQSPAASVWMTDPLGSSMEFLRWVNRNGAEIANDQLTWNGTISASQAISWSWVMSQQFGYDITVVNTARWRHPDTGASGTASTSFTVQSEPALSIGKWVTPASEVTLHSEVTYTVLLTNTGGLAAGTFLTDALPAAVDFVQWVEQNGAEATGDTVAWTGDVPAAETARFVWVAEYVMDTGGSVTNTVEYLYSSVGQHGSAEASFTSGDSVYYLPVIFKNFAAMPDLVVSIVEAGSASVTVVVTNQGNKTATDDFWIDVSFNPRVRPPQINQPWPTIAGHGVTWGVTLDLPPNVPLILTNDPADPYYFPQYSSQPPLPAGEDVYAYVDSVNWATTYGAVLESNEGNNTDGPVVSVMIDLQSNAPAATGRNNSWGNLPPR